MRFFRVVLSLYAVLLTLLLLHPSPFSLFGGSQAAKLAPSVGQHFLAFSVLGFFVAASRLPVPFGIGLSALLAYAAGTEMLQALIPPRNPSIRDFVENVLGIACGITAWLALVRAWAMLRLRPDNPSATASRAGQ